MKRLPILNESLSLLAILATLVGCAKDESSTVAVPVTPTTSNPAKPGQRMAGAEAGLSPNFANAPKPGSALNGR